MARQRYNPDTGEMEDVNDSSYSDSGDPSSVGNMDSLYPSDAEKGVTRVEANSGPDRMTSKETVVPLPPGPGGNNGGSGGSGSGGGSRSTDPPNPYDVNRDVPAYRTPDTSELTALIRSMVKANEQNMAFAAEDREQKAAWNKRVRQNIMDALAQANIPVTESDPIIARELQISDFNNQRNFQQSREAMAARSAAGGGPTAGAADAALQSGIENLGIAKNSLSARLMADERDKRRNQVTSLLNTEAGVLTADESTQVQRDLGVMDNIIASLREKGSREDTNRGMDISQFGVVGGLSNNFTSIGNQNRQFYDRLSYDAQHDAAMMNYLYAQLAGGSGR